MRRAVRTLYAWTARTPLLRDAVARVRTHPRVRAYARRHVGVLLQPGGTWANVDSSLRLIAEDKGSTVAFGAWPGDTTGELLYWVPFVRWAQRHFALDPARLVAVSHGGVAHWYAGACDGYVEDVAGAADVLFPAEPVHALVEEYRAGRAAPRPLMKRAVHEQLTVPADPVTDALPEGYVANDDSLEDACRGVPAGSRRRAEHAVLAGARGVVVEWSGLAVLAALSGVPVFAVRPEGTQLCEADVDLALRITSGLTLSLNVLDRTALNGLLTVIGLTEQVATVDSTSGRAAP
jgi:hypothetical protein